MIKQEPQKGQPAHSDWKEWNDYRIKLIQNSPERLESGAKQILSLITLSISIFAAFGFKNLSEIYSPTYTTIIFTKTALICWLISAIMALAVILPFHYKLNSINTKETKSLLEKITTQKRKYLRLSLISFGIGIVILVIIILQI